MKTIQMSVDESLLAEVDRAIVSLNTTRSAFVREALQLALMAVQTRRDGTETCSGLCPTSCRAGRVRRVGN
jgi:metal-responsive CopG/Arc/MetJ family transcriptional regulator